ncbi:MAG: response regulator [Selenomonadaceae bacterium]|nr:response regulator [Selenomonadaceae bacterium]
MFKTVNELVIREAVEFLVLASILSVLGYFAYYKIDSMLKESLEESVALQAKSIAVGLRNQFEEKFHRLQAVALLTSNGKVAIEDIDDLFLVGAVDEEMGIIDRNNEPLKGNPLPARLMEKFANVFNGENVVIYDNEFGLIFALPVKIYDQDCMLYNRNPTEWVKKTFHAVSYNGTGTILLLNNMENWMVLSEGAELINLEPEMRPGWYAIGNEFDNSDDDSLSMYYKFKGKGYFLYVAEISKEQHFAISGYVPWKSVAVGIDYIYIIMLVTFGVILLLLIVGVQYIMKARRAKHLEKEKSLADSANKAKSDFLSNMSHEIRTPINAIMGMDEMILRESKEPSTLEYAQNLQNAARSLLSLINDILDFSKIEAGKMEIIPVEYHIGSVLNDLVNMIRKRAENKGLELIIEADKTLPSVLFGDEIRIKQIVTNLLTNAVKYTEKGSVTLKVNYTHIDDENIYLKVSITDTGIGIKDEDLQKLFSAFERIEEERNRNIEGTGLGMNITKKLLAMMGTKLVVDSIYGEGSTFSFQVVQRVVNPEPIGDFEESYRRSLAHHSEYHESFTAPDATILVVDDTVMNLTVVKGLLKQTKIKIDTAVSGYECLEMVKKKKYDIIFLDHRMPGMDGIETLQVMKELTGNLNKETPVISLTANAISGAREQYIAAGFQDYLTKPINAAQLEKTIIKYLQSDKVFTSSEIVQTSTDSNEESALPEWLTTVEGLSLKAGIEHCGSKEAYLDVLNVFANSIASASKEIEKYFIAEDWRNYTTKVHALKSTSKVVGAEELSERAKRLEDAGNSGYIDEIKQDHEPLIELYKSYAEKLKPLIQVEEDDVDKPLIDEAELAEAFEAMKDAAATFDYDSLMFVFQSLDEYRLPEGESERYKQIKEAASKLDWETIKSVLKEGE